MFVTNHLAGLTSCFRVCQTHCVLFSKYIRHMSMPITLGPSSLTQSAKSFYIGYYISMWQDVAFSYIPMTFAIVSAWFMTDAYIRHAGLYSCLVKPRVLSIWLSARDPLILQLSCKINTKLLLKTKLCILYDVYTDLCIYIYIYITFSNTEKIRICKRSIYVYFTFSLQLMLMIWRYKEPGDQQS